MYIKCYKCGHEWNYKGKGKITKCRCNKNVSIEKALKLMKIPYNKKKKI